MVISLKNRCFLTLLDFSASEILYLINLAADFKKIRNVGLEKKQLQGKKIALIFEKPSTRTRCAFEVAAYDQGAHTTYLSSGTQIGGKESIKDTARVLGRLFDGIEYRGRRQRDLTILAEHAQVPVWNGLTDQFHPIQILADLLTIQEKLGSFQKKRITFFGDGHNNVARSLMIGCTKMGMDFVLCCPAELVPKPDLIQKCRDFAQASGGSLRIEFDPVAGAEKADVIYTDVWVSMGDDKALWSKRIKMLSRYQVNSDLFAAAKPSVIFMHCLPALHNNDTLIGKALGNKYHMNAFEVTEFVFESQHSVVFDQAENRLHTTKALMVATLA